MSEDEAASQALIYYKIFDYVKDNKNKFINTNDNDDEDKLTIEDVIDMEREFGNDLRVLIKF